MWISRSVLLNRALATLVVAIGISGCKVEPEQSDSSKPPNSETARHDSVCAPDQTIQSLSCSDQIPHSLVATQNLKCNSEGTESLKQECVLESCENGYTRVANDCIVHSCVPDAVSSISCISEISHSSVATKSRTCDSDGLGFEYDVCQAGSCEAGYYLSNNTCLPQECVPNAAAAPIDCTIEYPHSSVAVKSKTCNSIGNGYDYGTCAVSVCQTGYSLSGNSCVPIITNGDFETGQMSPWLSDAGGIVDSPFNGDNDLAGKLFSVSPSGGMNVMLSQTLNSQAGKTYEISLSLRVTCTNGQTALYQTYDAGSFQNRMLNCGTKQNVTWQYTVPNSANAPGIFGFFFSAMLNNGSFSSVTWYLDSIRVREL